MKAKHILYSFFILYMILGCSIFGSRYWDYMPIRESINNEFFEATISPGTTRTNGFNFLIFRIKNKSDGDIEINWDKTFYIDANGEKNGFFLLSKSPSRIITANSTFEKHIYPTKLKKNIMKKGVHGIFLSVMVNGQEINGEMTVGLFPVPSYYRSDGDYRSNIERRADNLQIGMTKSEVWKVIGYEYNLKSTTSTALGKMECYEVVSYPRVILYFLDGKLESWTIY